MADVEGVWGDCPRKQSDAAAHLAGGCGPGGCPGQPCPWPSLGVLLTPPLPQEKERQRLEQLRRKEEAEQLRRKKVEEAKRQRQEEMRL